jgi:hypothetical protein
MLIDTQIRLPQLNMAALSNRDPLKSNKPTLVFLHGYLDNANSFATLLPLLSDYQCICIDMAGHGKSQHRSGDAHYHLSDYAYDLYQLILTLQLSNFVLVGHSLGAIVASLYAATQPQGLSGFIAIESCGPLSEKSDSTAKQLSNCFTSRARANNPIKQPTSLEAVVKARCAISDLSTEQAVLIISRNLIIDIKGKVQWRTDKRLRTKSPMRMTEEQVCNILDNVTCQRILILGNQGFEKIKIAIKARSSVFFEAPVFTFSGGHHVHLESTGDVADCIHKYAKQFFKP